MNRRDFCGLFAALPFSRLFFGEQKKSGAFGLDLGKLVGHEYSCHLIRSIQTNENGERFLSDAHSGITLIYEYGELRFTVIGPPIIVSLNEFLAAKYSTAPVPHIRYKNQNWKLASISVNNKYKGTDKDLLKFTGDV